VRLAGVAPGSPAEKSGLKEGDVITKVDGKDCEEVKAYSALFFSKRPGQEMLLDYLRDGKPATLKVVLGVKRTSDE
jgi:serine protease Do